MKELIHLIYMNKKKIKFKLILLIGLSSHFQTYGACIGGEDCYPLIEQNTKNTQNLTIDILSKLSDIANLAQEKELKLGQFTQLYLQLIVEQSPPYPKLTYTKTDTYKKLDDQYQASKDSATNLSTETINKLLGPNVTDGIEQKIFNLKITPNDKIYVFGIPTPVANTNEYLNVHPFIFKTNLESNETFKFLNYIDIATGLLSPVQIQYPSSPGGTPEGMTREKYNSHLIESWQNVAFYSVISNYFYNLLTKKVIVTNLGQGIAIPLLPGGFIPSNANYLLNDASPLDIERYQANRYSVSEQWNTDIGQSPEIIIDREQVYTLAELHRQLYQRYKSREILLTSITTAFSQNKLVFDKLAALLESTIPPSSSTTTPPGGTGGTPGGDGGSTTPGDEPTTTPGTSSPGSAKCFIATSVYGQESWQVKKLRQFRDIHLKSNSLGVISINLYYNYSPQLIPYLEKSNFLKSTTRYVIDCLVENLE